MALTARLRFTDELGSVVPRTFQPSADPWQNLNDQLTASSGNQRLGLHVTSNELAIWQDRMTDNVNTINGITFQNVYQQRILADANSFIGQSHPGGDGHWEGKTTAGCIPCDDTWHPGSGGTPWNRGNGYWLMASAFNFLLTGDSDYANPVRSELLQQITEAGTDWTDGTRWCLGDPVNLCGANYHMIFPWFYRLIISYDYLLAGGYTGFSGAEQTNIEAWFTDGAELLMAAVNYAIDNFTNYPGINDSPQSMTCSGDCTSLEGTKTHNAGVDVRAATLVFFNQITIPHAVGMAVGILTNNSTLIDFAKAYFTAFITAGVFDDGAHYDYIYWTDSPGSMWGHAGATWTALTSIADHLARTGDTSLYDLEVPTQALGGSGGDVSLYKMLRLMAELANGTTTYTVTVGGDDWPLTWNTDFALPIVGDYYYDMCAAVANLYYQDAEIKTAMERNTAGRTNSSSACFDGDEGDAFSCFGGLWACWADLPFMFGKMDGVVDPFNI